MRQIASVLLCLTPLACAQHLIPPGELNRLNLEPRTGDRPLRCEVTPLPPSIDFAFRMEAGYAFHIPQSQYSGNTSGWSILIAITPEHGEAAYLLERSSLASAARNGPNFDIRGIYLLGSGRYSVDATVRDGRNRVCRKQWPVVVKPSLANRAIPLAIPPGTIVEFSPVAPPVITRPDSNTPVRLSIMLNAAAFSMYRTVIRPYDRSVLLGALTSLIDHVPATSVRLVVFSLEQQREVFRTANFTPADIGKIADAFRSLEQTTVDVHVLQKPLGHVDFLANLIRREFAEPDAADKLVFLGPTSRYGPNIPKGMLPQQEEGSPRMFYVRYGVPRRPVGPIQFPGNLTMDASSPTGRGGGEGGGRRGQGDGGPLPPMEGQSDIITAAISRLRGKTLMIHTPADLAKAIRKIEGS
jgi:hypothetical protein